MKNTQNGLELCEESLDRLIRGKPNNLKFLGKPITPSLVSKEAGLDKGYLKKSRHQHRLIIFNIDEHCRLQTKASPKASEDIPKLKAQKSKIKNELQLVTQRLNDSLAREVILVHQLRKIELELILAREGRN